MFWYILRCAGFGVSICAFLCYISKFLMVRERMLCLLFDIGVRYISHSMCLLICVFILFIYTRLYFMYLYSLSGIPDSCFHYCFRPHLVLGSGRLLGPMRFLMHAVLDPLYHSHLLYDSALRNDFLGFLRISYAAMYLGVFQ